MAIDDVVGCCFVRRSREHADYIVSIHRLLPLTVRVWWTDSVYIHHISFYPNKWPVKSQRPNNSRSSSPVSSAEMAAARVKEDKREKMTKIKNEKQIDKTNIRQRSRGLGKTKQKIEPWHPLWASSYPHICNTSSSWGTTRIGGVRSSGKPRFGIIVVMSATDKQREKTIKVKEIWLESNEKMQRHEWRTRKRNSHFF